MIFSGNIADTSPTAEWVPEAASHSASSRWSDPNPLASRGDVWCACGKSDFQTVLHFRCKTVLIRHYSVCRREGNAPQCGDSAAAAGTAADGVNLEGRRGADPTGQQLPPDIRCIYRLLGMCLTRQGLKGLQCHCKQAAEAQAGSSSGAHALWGACGAAAAVGAGRRPAAHELQGPRFPARPQGDLLVLLCSVWQLQARPPTDCSSTLFAPSVGGINLFLQVSINMLQYGLGRSQSVPLQLGLAAAIRAAAAASPATAVAAVDFMRYTESHLAEALAERRSSAADRCMVPHEIVAAACYA
jgi:hypothetical protein